MKNSFFVNQLFLSKTVDRLEAAILNQNVTILPLRLLKRASPASLASQASLKCHNIHQKMVSHQQLFLTITVFKIISLSDEKNTNSPLSVLHFFIGTQWLSLSKRMQCLTSQRMPSVPGKGVTHKKFSFLLSQFFLEDEFV